MCGGDAQGFSALVQFGFLSSTLTHIPQWGRYTWEKTSAPLLLILGKHPLIKPEKAAGVTQPQSVSQTVCECCKADTTETHSSEHLLPT